MNLVAWPPGHKLVTHIGYIESRSLDDSCSQLLIEETEYTAIQAKEMYTQLQPAT